MASTSRSGAWRASGCPGKTRAALVARLAGDATLGTAVPAPDDGSLATRSPPALRKTTRGCTADALNDIIWCSAVIYLCLGAGLYFSIRPRFVQLRGVPEMIRLMFVGSRSDARVSSFQALAMPLSGRVGIGNIAGVATAIAAGGPGAVFWMW